MKVDKSLVEVALVAALGATAGVGINEASKPNQPDPGFVAARDAGEVDRLKRFMETLPSAQAPEPK